MAIFSGDIFAEQYVISSSVTEVTIGSVSGSTAFGDSNDDTHQFTGSLLISGSSIALDGVNSNVIIGKNTNLNINAGSTGLTAIGLNAAGGDASTELSGDDITTIGSQAGRSMEQNPHRTTLVGAQTGRNLSVGLDNTFVGALAGYQLTVADRNVFVGSYAGYQTVDVDNAVADICVIPVVGVFCDMVTPPPAERVEKISPVINAADILSQLILEALSLDKFKGSVTLPPVLEMVVIPPTVLKFIPVPAARF
jgi:hypothetical protein